MSAVGAGMNILLNGIGSDLFASREFVIIPMNRFKELEEIEKKYEKLLRKTRKPKPHRRRG